MTEEALDSRVEQLMGVRGGLRKAAQLLEPGEVAEADNECFATMQAKHPAAAAGEDQHQLQTAFADIMAAAEPSSALLHLIKEEGAKPEEFVRLIARASPFSGAGPSGLRYSHLQQAMASAWGRDGIPQLLSQYANLVIHDAHLLPPLFWQLHSAARLTPLTEQQPGGGSKLRPIACGEVLQRLCTSVFVRDRQQVIADALEPLG